MQARCVVCGFVVLWFGLYLIVFVSEKVINKLRMYLRGGGACEGATGVLQPTSGGTYLTTNSIFGDWMNKKCNAELMDCRKASPTMTSCGHAQVVK